MAHRSSEHRCRCCRRCLWRVAKGCIIDAFPTSSMKQLALNVAGLGDLNQLKKLAGVVGKSDESGQWWKTAFWSLAWPWVALSVRMPLFPKALLLPKRLPDDSGCTRTNRPCRSKGLRSRDREHRQSDVDRVAAMALMSHLPPEALTTALDTLLSTGESSDCQRAAISAVCCSGRADLAASVLDRWDNLLYRCLGPCVVVASKKKRQRLCCRRWPME